MEDASCPFCKELETGKIKINETQELLLDRIIYSSENLAVFPSFGPIVEGHLLIVPKQHHISIAQMPQLHSELSKVQEKIRETLTKNYCEPIFFEHGPISRYEKAGCCIEHAHLHAVPTSSSILEEITRNFDYQEIKGFSKLPTQTAYLFLEEKEKRYVFPIREVLPSQYLRQVLAAKLGVPERWNWRDSFGLEEVKKTIKKLQNQIPRL